MLLEKLAFDESSYQKVLDSHRHMFEVAPKKYLNRKSTLNINPVTKKMKRYGYNPNERIIFVPTLNEKKLSPHGVAHEAMEKRYHKESGKYEKSLFHKTLAKSQLGDMIKRIENTPSFLRGEYRSRSKMRALRDLHSYASQKAQKAPLRFHGHGSEYPMLAEHNFTTTSPKGFMAPEIKAANKFKERRGASTIERAIPGFKFGKSPRLSRHAMRRIVDIIARKRMV